MNGGKEIIDSLLGDPTEFKGVVTFRGERVGIEGNERVFGGMLFEGVIEGEKAGEVSCVCYKSCPYLMISAFYSRLAEYHLDLFWSPQLEWDQDQLSRPCSRLFTYLPQSSELCKRTRKSFRRWYSRV